MSLNNTEDDGAILNILWAQLSVAIPPEYSHENADEHTFLWQEAGD